MEVIVGVIIFILILVIVNSIISSAEQQQKSHQGTNHTKEYTLPSGRKITIDKETDRRLSESAWRIYQDMQSEKVEEVMRDPLGQKKREYISFIESVRRYRPTQFNNSFGNIKDLNNLSLRRIEEIYTQCLSFIHKVEELYELDIHKDTSHNIIDLKKSTASQTSRNQTSHIIVTPSIKKTPPIVSNKISTNNKIEQKNPTTVRPQEKIAQKKIEIHISKESSSPTPRSKDTLSVKAEHKEIKQYLNENNIQYFYHFTDRSNLSSIKEYGGLYSWKYCLSNNITIPKAGGGESSRSLDRRYNLEDYVRLSFCTDHPMVFRLKQNGYNLVLLKIKIDVAWLRDTLFSDMNATDNMHCHGPNLSDLQRINIDATKSTFVSNGHPYFKPHQAEVMVKTCVPLEYIINIDDPFKL